MASESELMGVKISVGMVKWPWSETESILGHRLVRVLMKQTQEDQIQKKRDRGRCQMPYYYCIFMYVCVYS